jgi:hypothetical protein
MTPNFIDSEIIVSKDMVTPLKSLCIHSNLSAPALGIEDVLQFQNCCAVIILLMMCAHWEEV